MALGGADAHGLRGAQLDGVLAPRLLLRCDRDARPGYDTCSASEYQDCAATLRLKAALAAQMLSHASFPILYTGAGISTAAGVSDYASLASGGASLTKRMGACDAPPSPLLARPTLAHRVLAALVGRGAGRFKRWVQQNHDGLPQKAGVPQAFLNEVHGAWQDPSNPVVPMSGALRADLFDDMERCAARSDLCLVLGTSLCGMNADQCATRPPASIIVGLQRTVHDASSALRVFATCDAFCAELAKALGVWGSVRPDALYRLEEHVPDFAERRRALLQGAGASAFSEPDVYAVRYGRDGRRSATPRVLDLRDGAMVAITQGQFAGDPGEVIGRTHEGYNIRFLHATESGTRVPAVRVLGLWWVASAMRGELERLPVVSAPEAGEHMRTAALTRAQITEAAVNKVELVRGGVPEWAAAAYRERRSADV